jgi:replicative DNA helicase
MPLQKPRTRVVYFRVSEEEFVKLNQLSEMQGARSLSELLRTTMHNMLAEAEGLATTTAVVTRLETLERMLTDVSQALMSMRKNP